MSKFKVYFEGYPEDLVRTVGMAMNSLVRKICEEQGAKPVKSTFLRPETATPEWLRTNIEGQVAVALFQRPKESRSINELARRVAVEYERDITEWIEENKVNLAEIGFLFNPEDPASPPEAVPPYQNAAIARPQGAVPKPPATPQKITGFICRRGKR